MRNAYLLATAIVAVGCGPSTPQPAPPPSDSATAALTAASTAPEPTVASTPPEPAVEATATCEKKESLCEHSEIAKLIALGWQIGGSPEGNAERLDAALRRGPLFIRKGGPEAFDPCIVQTPMGQMSLNKDAPMAAPEGPSKPCLIVYPDEATAASDCHLETEKATLAELAQFAASKGMGISVTCKQFAKTILPKELAAFK